MVPVAGTFLTAFGFVSALATMTTAGPGAVLGLVGGVLVGVSCASFTLAVLRMPTREAAPDEQLVGRHGTVTVEVGRRGDGRVLLRDGDRQLSLSATSEMQLAAGTPVVIVETETPVSVRVAPSQLEV